MSPRVTSPQAQSPAAAATPRTLPAPAATSSAGFGSAMQPPSPRRRMQVSAAAASAGLPVSTTGDTLAAVPIKLEARLAETAEAGPAAATRQPAGEAAAEAVPAAAGGGQSTAATPPDEAAAAAYPKGQADGTAAASALQPALLGLELQVPVDSGKPLAASVAESSPKAVECQMSPQDDTCGEQHGKVCTGAEATTSVCPLLMSAPYP